MKWTVLSVSFSNRPDFWSFAFSFDLVDRIGQTDFVRGMWHTVCPSLFLTRQFNVMVSRILLQGFLRKGRPYTVHVEHFVPSTNFWPNPWKLLNHLTLFSESTLRSLIILIKQTSSPFPPFKWFIGGLPVPLLKSIKLVWLPN